MPPAPFNPFTAFGSLRSFHPLRLLGSLRSFHTLRLLGPFRSLHPLALSAIAATDAVVKVLASVFRAVIINGGAGPFAAPASPVHLDLVLLDDPVPDLQPNPVPGRVNPPDLDTAELRFQGVGQVLCGRRTHDHIPQADTELAVLILDPKSLTIYRPEIHLLPRAQLAPDPNENVRVRPLLETPDLHLPDRRVPDRSEDIFYYYRGQGRRCDLNLIGL